MGERSPSQLRSYPHICTYTHLYGPFLLRRYVTGERITIGRLHAWLGGGGGGDGLWGTRGDGGRHHTDRGRRAVQIVAVAVAAYATITAGGNSLVVGHATGGAVGRFLIVCASCWRIRAAEKKKKARAFFISSPLATGTPRRQMSHNVLRVFPTTGFRHRHRRRASWEGENETER